MAPDPRLDEMSLAREAEAAARENRSFPKPEIQRFGSTTVGLTDGDILGSLVGALSGALVGLVVALLVFDGLALTIALPLIGAALGALLEAVIAGGRAEELRMRATQARPPARRHGPTGRPAMRRG